MKQGFGWYILRFPTYTLVYGAFAIIPIFMLWIYLCWLTILFGSVLTAQLPVWSRWSSKAIPFAIPLTLPPHFLQPTIFELMDELDEFHAFNDQPSRISDYAIRKKSNATEFMQ
jgi:hypothetical protein